MGRMYSIRPIQQDSGRRERTDPQKLEARFSVPGPECSTIYRGGDKVRSCFRPPMTIDRLRKGARRDRIRVLRLLNGERSPERSGPTGDVGTIFRGSGFEAVWVRKQAEAIDSSWFSQNGVDLLFVVQGRLRVEFEDPHEPKRTLEVGDVLVLPARTKCRAYRWPRAARGPTVFIAVYPEGRRRPEAMEGPSR
jgi:hypothetical protein